MAYAKINENGQLTYATIKNGALIVDGKMVFCTEDNYPKYGYYQVKNIAENPVARMGNVVLDEENSVILNYIGAPYVPEVSEVVPNVPTAHELRMMEIEGRLSNTEELIEAMERLIAANGVTEEDKAMAQARIALRDELGKVIQTEEGDGSMENPSKWTDGMAVEVGKWYKTPSDYLWEAIKDGTPSSETDNEYFDVVGL